MSPTLAKDAGRLKLRSTRQYQPRFSPPRFTSDSVLGAKLTSPTSSYPRCGINLVDTWRNPRANPKWLEGTLPAAFSNSWTLQTLCAQGPALRWVGRPERMDGPIRVSRITSGLGGHSPGSGSPPE